MLIRYGDLVGSYHSSLGNSKLIIRCSGMPGLPDDNDIISGVLQKSGYDVVKPDYYGYARSGGLFTPSGCVQTVLDTAETFRQGKIFDVWGNQELTVSYDEIVLVGSSFGGWIACMAPKFDATIKEVVLCYPQLAPAKYGTLGLPEETSHEFRRTCKQGYNGLFRWGQEQERQAMFADGGPYIPTVNYDHLSNISVFLGHGTADDVINYSRTKDFYKQLLTFNPSGDYHYEEYYGLGHGGTCKQAILEGWLRKKKQEGTKGKR